VLVRDYCLPAVFPSVSHFDVYFALRFEDEAVETIT